jgi:hypothetical protein
MVMTKPPPQISNLSPTIRSKHSHYHKDVRNLEFVDVYRVLTLFNVTDPCIQHAVKKLLVAGGRGAGKDISRDIQESIDSLVRWQEMRDEEGRIDLKNTTALYRVSYAGRQPDSKTGMMRFKASSEQEAIRIAQDAFHATYPNDGDTYDWEAFIENGESLQKV